ncbi:5-oxoprolinase subunit PxpA [Telmatospirillum siberiense]|uniref:Lactam utilization protein LamB n=1 Tax=Telmatospirillum siberiense TaxID=382514 RepID=A0A2N3PR26_9PROT|nr:5-oxoprolinase subunit PxpA [Telmatospirillum siberiense]PKU22855.1 lactam utilization protein LamB [Telmatospirillum siberiense]
MLHQAVDVNCDLGEGFGHWSLGETPDIDLLPLISSANIATGFHAGDPTRMDYTVQHATRLGIGLGAHPGYRDLVGFGRRFLDARADELVNDVLYQLGALSEFAGRHGGSLQHVKLHGALYMHAAADEDFATLLIDTLRRVRPDLYVYCMAGSALHRAAEASGHPAVREFYADRDYGRDGSIVFRRQIAAPDPLALADKVVRACRDGMVTTVDGEDIPIAFDSICFHSDTPGALAIGRTIRASLQRHGIRIAPLMDVVHPRTPEDKE